LIADLSPLNGMSLTTLTVEGCKVFDLTPVTQMPLDSLCIYGTKVGDLRPIAGKKLTNLIIMATPVTDLSTLRGMPLKSLNCLSTGVSDLSPLHDCPSLTSLNVKQTKVTASGVAALQKALPNCKIEWDGENKGSGAGIQVPGVGVPGVGNDAPIVSDRQVAEWVLSKGGVVDVVIDSAWQQVSEANRLPQQPFKLATINLERMMNGEGMKLLGGLTSLVELDIHASKLTDDDLLPLATLKNLEVLDLQEVPIGDRSIARLHGLSKLKELRISGTKATPAAIDSLQKALPKCKIE
jgi:Leucine-rich repeat (LRR) protein